MAVSWLFSLHPALPGIGGSPIFYMDSYPHVSYLSKMLQGWVFTMGISES